ncbi:hypothetical protein [Hyphomonas sp.]|mgnify:CR=1 FL=1|uniref:hypothetical protein n=1 Tax=Hyphomonas sp. TaxID=87 RepID=UPI000C3C00B4|nr:hypothetical protein [Hyphomonas sp.]MAB11782.1 hypothetical protein [Hyphomonas sp.]MAU65525.1 hypothetical protein [Hyphomonas sp.]MBM59357.1 hypothetical protein [Hyphomonas sp.]|tara:strand:+ start:131 stop:379 length:249 start_codon:yes stop_codon:yes gene_type:complete
MNGMDRRLKALEKKAGQDRDLDEVIIVRFVSPFPDLSGPDPNTPAAGWALIRSGQNAGMTLHPHEGETWATFERRVDEAKVA